MRINRILFSIALAAMCLFSTKSYAQDYEIVENIYGREKIDLNGTWKVIPDPMETGLKKSKYRRNFPADDVAILNEGELIEYEWDSAWDIQVPGDWNSQIEGFEWYEGLMWYRKKVNFSREEGYRYLLYFEAVNYISHVYLNGTKLGQHEGGFTPFQFDITDLLDAENSIVLAVDNTRKDDGIPAKDFDWWNYGGITRPVWILKIPDTYIHSYTFSYQEEEIHATVKLESESKKETEVEISIPKLGISQRTKIIAPGMVEFVFRPQDLELWSPENPKLFDVELSTSKEKLEDRIGFRTIEAVGPNLLLNGESIFLRGICLHEEAIGVPTRALNWETAKDLLEKAVAMNANFVRLAHYPHTEKMVRLADSLGLMVWSEIPVYWEDMDYQNPKTQAMAQQMLTTNYLRDKNRASIIIWSVANETPITEHRNAFLKSLIHTVRDLDETRLVSAALKVSHSAGVKTIDDPLGAYLDVLSINQYVGWYGMDYPDKITDVTWETSYNKPMLLSEFGAGALAGNYGDKMTRWTEEFQAYFIDQTMQMATDVPFLRGTMPWILKDFRTPRRYHGAFQNYWNRKGLIDENGVRKQAFNTLLSWYNQIEKDYD